MRSNEVYEESDEELPPDSHPSSPKVGEANVKEAENQREIKIDPGRTENRNVLRLPSVSSARFATPWLTKQKHEQLKRLLDQYKDSVNFCIQKCLEHKVTSRASLWVRSMRVRG